MSTRDRVLELIEYVKEGRIVDAIQEFYADGVTMQENREPPRGRRRLSLKKKPSSNRRPEMAGKVHWVEQVK